LQETSNFLSCFFDAFSVTVNIVDVDLLLKLQGVSPQPWLQLEFFVSFKPEQEGKK